MANNIETQYNEAVLYYEKKHYEHAYKIFLELAKGGDIDSQNAVARMLHTGRGVDEDIEQGYMWYQKSAKQDSATGSFMYGNYCIEKNNIQEGISYIEAAAKQNYPTAIYTQAVFYDHGEYGYKKDKDLALTLYEKAYKLGEKVAGRSMLNLYKEQHGIFKMFKYTMKNIFRL